MLLIVIASLFLFHSFLNQFIFLKVLGIVLIMFSIYRLQSGIPSKSNIDETNFVVKEEEE